MPGFFYRLSLQGGQGGGLGRRLVPAANCIEPGPPGQPCQTGLGHGARVWGFPGGSNGAAMGTTPQGQPPGGLAHTRERL